MRRVHLRVGSRSGHTRRAGARVLMVAAGVVAGLASAAGAQTAVSDGQGVSIGQVDYALDGQPADVSATGEAIVNYSQLTTATGMSSGYLNIQDSAGWVVQNLPIIPGLTGISTHFNLGTADGTNDTSAGLNLSVDVSAAPVTSFTPTPATHFAVGAATDDTEGEGATAGNPAAPAANALTFVNNGQNRLTLQLGHPNVQAADNQCGPAAFANGLTFLKNTAGLNIPDPNVPGRGAPAGAYPQAGILPGDAKLTVPNGVVSGNVTETQGNSLVGQLDLAIARTSRSRTDGDTTTGDQQVPGVEKYLGSTRVGDAGKVVIETQGTGVFTNFGITNTDFGANVTPNFLFNELSAGKAVKVGYTGHAIDVIATGSIDGVPWVAYQSDHLQTPVDKPDALLNNAPGFLANIPDFSFLDTTGANPVFVNESGTPTAFNAIAIGVPEPTGCAVLVLSAAMLFRRRGQRAS